MQRSTRAVLASLVAAACGGVRNSDSPPGDGGTSGPGSAAGTNEVSSGPHPADSDAPKLDVHGAEGAVSAEGGDGVGCAKADFLFVIDNSASMADEQANLIASFPGFIATIQDTLKADDYHLMVVDTDALGGGGDPFMCTNNECTCSPSPGCCGLICSVLDTSCNGIPCGMLPNDECDRTLGAGKVFRDDGVQCLDAPPRFMTDTSAMVSEQFACVAEVGISGHGNEQPMAAILAATHESMATTGACNEGFLRKDAILVVTVITDEDDADKSPGDPASWYRDLVDVKNGDPKAIVMLGLIGDTGEPGGVCQPFDAELINGAENGVRLRQYVEKFGSHGVLGSVCSPDYAPFFSAAVAVIDLACDGFVPPG